MITLQSYALLYMNVSLKNFIITQMQFRILHKRVIHANKNGGSELRCQSCILGMLVFGHGIQADCHCK